MIDLRFVLNKLEMIRMFEEV